MNNNDIAQNPEAKYLTLNEVKLENSTNVQIEPHDDNEDFEDDDSTVCCSARSFATDLKNDILEALSCTSNDELEVKSTDLPSSVQYNEDSFASDKESISSVIKQNNNNNDKISLSDSDQQYFPEQHSSTLPLPIYEPEKYIARQVNSKQIKTKLPS